MCQLLQDECRHKFAVGLCYFGMYRLQKCSWVKPTSWKDSWSYWLQSKFEYICMHGFDISLDYGSQLPNHDCSHQDLPSHLAGDGPWRDMVVGTARWICHDVLPDLSLYASEHSKLWWTLQCPRLSDQSIGRLHQQLSVGNAWWCMPRVMVTKAYRSISHQVKSNFVLGNASGFQGDFGAVVDGALRVVHSKAPLLVC